MFYVTDHMRPTQMFFYTLLMSHSDVMKNTYVLMVMSEQVSYVYMESVRSDVEKVSEVIANLYSSSDESESQ